MNTKNTRKGFTTVELVIVIAVIAILATVLIPTFSNMINQANLSTDKQNVRNMNMVLLTYMIEGTEDFGDVRKQLLDGGYKTGEKFAPKTAGYKYYWYVDRDDRNEDGKEEDISVILLVDETNPDAPQVVYPEDYTDVTVEKLKNIRMCFDLSLPAVMIEKNGKPEDSEGNQINVTETTPGFEYIDAPLSMMYTFSVNEEEGAEEYREWQANFYVSVKLPAGKTPVLSIAGQYDENGPEWVPQTYLFDQDYSNVPLLPDGKVAYSDVLSWGEFNCGIVNDVEGDDDQGVVLTVELRLTEAKWNSDNNQTELVDGGREVVLGIFTYTYK